MIYDVTELVSKNMRVNELQALLAVALPGGGRPHPSSEEVINTKRVAADWLEDYGIIVGPQSPAWHVAYALRWCASSSTGT